MNVGTNHCNGPFFFFFFPLLRSVKCLVAPLVLDRRCRFLLRVVTDTTRLQSTGGTRRHIPACAYPRTHACTDPWQVGRAVRQRQGQGGSGHGRVLSEDQLSSARRYPTRLHAGKSATHKKKKFFIFGRSRLYISPQFSNTWLKWCKTKCGSSSESVIERGGRGE